MSKEKITSFEKLAAVNVDKLREKKGRFDYLSWAVALRELKKVYPTATFEVIKYDNKPYCASELGVFVEVAVTVDGLTQSQIHPVLDNNNRPIPKPNSFQINSSIQRCLAKAIALHGLGLSLFAGEDLVQYDEPIVTQSNTQSPPSYTPNTPDTPQQNNFTPYPASEKQKNVFKNNDINFNEDLDKKTATQVIDLVFKGIKPPFNMVKTEDFKIWVTDQTYQPSPDPTPEPEVELYSGTTSLNEVQKNINDAFQVQKNMNESVDPFELRSAPEESFRVTLDEVKLFIQEKSVEYLQNNQEELQSMTSFLNENDKIEANNFLAAKLRIDS